LIACGLIARGFIGRSCGRSELGILALHTFLSRKYHPTGWRCLIVCPKFAM
jgi:hypothetical protein